MRVRLGNRKALLWGVVFAWALFLSAVPAQARKAMGDYFGLGLEDLCWDELHARSGYSIDAVPGAQMDGEHRLMGDRGAHGQDAAVRVWAGPEVRRIEVILDGSLVQPCRPGLMDWAL